MDFSTRFSRGKDYQRYVAFTIKVKSAAPFSSMPCNATYKPNSTCPPLENAPTPPASLPTIKESVIESLNHGEIVVATGSFYIMHDVQIALGIAENGTDGFFFFLPNGENFLIDSREKIFYTPPASLVPCFSVPDRADGSKN